MADVEIKISGALLTGRAPAAIRSMMADIVDQVAVQALADVHLVLNQRIKHPTPYYETQITVQRVGETAVIHDRGVVYGPWLEGVSSRNATTRFKGYAAFRNAAQTANARASRLADSVVQRHMRELS